MAGDPSLAVRTRLERLGAWVGSIEDDALLAEPAEAWVAEHRPLHGLVLNAAPSFGSGGQDGLTRCLQAVWLAIRSVATGTLIADREAGQLLLIAPRPDAGAHAQAARAALENLARTLSVEWARFAVTTVAVCPGAGTTEAELAELISFLLSAGGRYLSGCRLDLGRAQDELRPASYTPAARGAQAGVQDGP